jgi:hypothetical protein
MSVNELRALTQQFADAFDQRDLTPAIEMLSEDVEVFDHVPYRFDGKQLFVKYLNEAGEGIVSASFGFRQPSCRVYRPYRGHRECLRHVYRGKQRRQGPVHPWPNYLGFRQTKRAVEDCERPLLSNATRSLTIRQTHAVACR